MGDRARFREIVKSTRDALSTGTIIVKGLQYDLNSALAHSKLQTAYYPPDSLLSTWPSFSPAQPHPAIGNTVMGFLETTTLDAARRVSEQGYKPIGVLSFASAEQPGGGFINGDNAQEESIVRSSTLYASLMTRTAQQFYTLHTSDGRNGFYTHAMVYSPDVVVFRRDDGEMALPMMIDVLTSPAVHAYLVRKHTAGTAIETEIKHTMRERMARILFLFEQRQVPHLILGSFGTGVFQNDVAMVAQIWAELLCGPSARFRRSFHHVAFAVIDGPTYLQFTRAFEEAKAQYSSNAPV
ncbi:hypothetical protein DFH08DRAFT_711895 [Mycena albidolilacea]|uniref:Microbial-type PARG catalytic domain-containing protein n=1 Tax=Mycena albidolilacea TaxID=1033008 RepID=A0AAD7EGL7_9AGAR|nr:hypothetical protein DFH08DRAFT_711895 [Mycena albidolilacea]